MDRAFPKRIISLVPSLTELIIDLGLGDHLVGRTRFCIHPADIVQKIPIVGGTKNPRLDKIEGLKPDLIVANKEENREEDIIKLKQKFQVLLTDISSITEALSAIDDIGQRVGAPQKAKVLIQQIRIEADQASSFKPINTLYLIWHQPWMTIGSDTYIHDVMQHWGLYNIFSDHLRYPEIDFKNLSGIQPELVLLSSEPFPFKEKHANEIRSILHEVPVHFVNGEWFSWYGSRMLPSFKKLNEWRRDLEI